MAIALVVTLPVQEGKSEEFDKVFLGLRDQVLANEDGCEHYDLYKQDDTTYIVLERYKDQAAFDAHGQTAYFKAAGPALGAVLGGAPDMKMLQSV